MVAKAFLLPHLLLAQRMQLGMEERMEPPTDKSDYDDDRPNNPDRPTKTNAPIPCEKAWEPKQSELGEAD